MIDCLEKNMMIFGTSISLKIRAIREKKTQVAAGDRGIEPVNYAVQAIAIRTYQLSNYSLVYLYAYFQI